MNITFDTEKLYEIMAHFYTLTKIRIVMFDDNFNQIVSVPGNDCGFCGALKENAALNERCKLCDMNARSVCRNTNNIHTYTCHAGLTESIAPIKMNGIILRYIMLGQIIDKSEKKEKKNEILSYARDYTDRDLAEEYDKLTTKNKKQIEAAANIMEACACYLWANRLAIYVGCKATSPLLGLLIYGKSKSDVCVFNFSRIRCLRTAIKRSDNYYFSVGIIIMNLRNKILISVHKIL